MYHSCEKSRWWRRSFEAGGNEGVYGNSLHFPLSFAMNLKLLSKNWSLIFFILKKKVKSQRIHIVQRNSCLTLFLSRSPQITPSVLFLAVGVLRGSVISSYSENPTGKRLLSWGSCISGFSKCFSTSYDLKTRGNYLHMCRSCRLHLCQSWMQTLFKSGEYWVP